MTKKFLFMLLGAVAIVSCNKFDLNYDEARQAEEAKEAQEVKENVANIFGVSFDSNHDWCTTVSGVVNITNIPSGTEKVQLLAYIADTDTTTSVLTLNEADVNGESTVSLSYDAPSDNLGLFVSFISNGLSTIKQVVSNNVSYNAKAMRRSSVADYTLPTTTPTINSTVESYASQRGWIEGQILYGYDIQGMSAQDYSDEYKTILRTIIFSYLKNGRQYNNLPLIKKSEYYNAGVYNITTGTDPIIISPIYKSDKAKQYGNEIWNSDLYYYYFKESDMAGMSKADSVAFLNNLPKYKAIEFKQHFGEEEDDVISKRIAYALVYWGDETPEVGTTGSYIFPEGYKIGFMVRAKTDFVENGKARKQGELYGDGRLNNEINNYSECNFKSSKLGTDGPRMGWMTVNGKMIMCFESGTDSDFNDIIIEVEGGVKPIYNTPEFENNYYTFCFEDRRLGDYDMNDIVIKATRIDKTTVEYSIVACGANDLLKVYIHNSQIFGDKEVHEMFGASSNTFINTRKGDTKFDPITKRITVKESFSFLDEDTQPFIYNITEGKAIKLSKQGEDPHGIMIPYDFKYPIEQICIKDVYARFNEWGQDKITSTDWYKYPIEGRYYE